MAIERAFGVSQSAEGDSGGPVPHPPARSRTPTDRASSNRKAVEQPLLEAKGWSILDWSAASDVDYNTASDFLSGKTKAYSSTRVKLATALGIDVAILPK